MGIISQTCAVELPTWFFEFSTLFFEFPTLIFEFPTLFFDKKHLIWLSTMTKAPTPTEMSKGQSDNKNNATKISITQRLRTDLGRSVGVTTATKFEIQRIKSEFQTFPLNFQLYSLNSLLILWISNYFLRISKSNL